MTKSDPELQTWPAEGTGAKANGQREASASLNAHVTSTVLSDEAVDVMLETATGASTPPIRREFALLRVIHDAAVEAARDGECTPVEEREPPHHHAYKYEVADSSATEPSLDRLAGTRIEILD